MDPLVEGAAPRETDPSVRRVAWIRVVSRDLDSIQARTKRLFHTIRWLERVAQVPKRLANGPGGFASVKMERSATRGGTHQITDWVHVTRPAAATGAGMRTGCSGEAPDTPSLT
jgi:hypothetical protein